MQFNVSVREREKGTYNAKITAAKEFRLQRFLTFSMRMCAGPLASGSVMAGTHYDLYLQRYTTVLYVFNLELRRW